MKEIKFRAWDKRAKMMKFGFFVGSIDGKARAVERIEPVQLSLPDDDLKLMQFTGLKDKNGKEIYEGDILSSKPLTKKETERIGTSNNIVVEWNKEYACFNIGYPEYEHEIIGNIYENPELLK